MPDPQLPWHEWFTADTIERAVPYADGGDVERVEYDGRQIIATVQGHKSYRTVILVEGLDFAADEGLVMRDLDARCSCPVASMCKHAAAACVVLARNHGVPDGVDDLYDEDANEDEPPQRVHLALPQPITPALPVAASARDEASTRVGQWLKGLGALAPTTQSEHRLIILLHAPQADRDAFWRVEAVLAKRLKSGAWGIGKRLGDPGQALDLLASTLPQPELHLLRRLATLRHPRHAWEPGWLDGACGATGELLADLIGSGRCHLEAPGSPPIRLGPERSATLRWREQRGGWRLEFAGVPGTLIPSDPPWWLDGGEAGPLATGLDAAACEAVRTMPVLPAALLPTALPVLASMVPGLPDPPVKPTAVPPSGYLLRCRVRLSPLNGYLHAGYDADTLAVWMRYGDVLVEVGGGALARTRAGAVVVRDLPGERALLAQLAGFGLATDSELKLARGPQAPSGSVPLAIHRSSFEAAGRLGQQRVEIPSAVIVAARAAGWTVEGEEQAALQDLAAETVEVAIGEPQGIDWFELHLGVKVGDERIDLTPVIAKLVAGGATARAELPRVELGGRAWLLMPLPDGRLVRLPEAEVLRLAAHIESLFDAQPASGRGWKVDAALALQLDELAGGRAIGGERLQRALEALRRLAKPEPAEVPPGLKAELRPYQRIGLGWMQRLRETGLGGVLADDMGLGKTVQTIAFLCAEQAAGRLGRPALVVCPASVVGTWKRELERFAPDLTVAVLHGQDRERDAAALGEHHVIITTYGTLLRDQDMLGSVELHVVVCDEAQVIKNAAAKAGAAVRRLKTRHRLALSGTPMENHLGELHTMMHWLAPGLLGDRTRFDRAFRKPIEQLGDGERMRLLRSRIAPFVLRRTKAAVAPELPPRTEATVPLDLTPAQRELYESVRLAMDSRIRQALAEKGLARSHIDILDALLKLRQVCCDPRLVRGSTLNVASSCKLDWLSETIPELVEDGRRILLFSQFTSLLDLVEADVLKPANVEWLRIDGSTQNRQALVDRFQTGEVPIFLLSLKAGGTGLTLTAADTVILLDPWWNPAAEAQAADRAHRIGQDKPVMIYRPVCSGTVEERIQEMQARKRGLADALWDGTGQAAGELTEDDLKALMAPLPT